jgi:hypothetical protein
MDLVEFNGNRGYTELLSENIVDVINRKKTNAFFTGPIMRDKCDLPGLKHFMIDDDIAWFIHMGFNEDFNSDKCGNSYYMGSKGKEDLMIAIDDDGRPVLRLKQD